MNCLQIDEIAKRRLTQHVSFDAFIDDLDAANIIDNCRICDVGFDVRAMRKQCTHRFFHLVARTLPLVNFDHRRQCFGYEVGVFVDNPVVKLQCRLTITCVPRDLRPRQRTALRSRTPALCLFYVRPGSCVVLPGNSLFRQLAIIVSNLQSQRLSTKHLEFLARFNGLLPFTFLFVNPAQLLERLYLVTGALRQANEKVFGTIQKPGTQIVFGE